MQFQDKVSTATTSDGHFSFCQETSPKIFFLYLLFLLLFRQINILWICSAIWVFTNLVSLQELCAPVTVLSRKTVWYKHTHTHAHPHWLQLVILQKQGKLLLFFSTFPWKQGAAAKSSNCASCLGTLQISALYFTLAPSTLPSCWSFDKFCENANSPFHQGLFLREKKTAENDVYDYLRARKTLNFCNGWSV